MPQTREVLAATVAGFAGAVAVNVAHETTRHLTPDAPRMDIVGMRGLARLTRAANLQPPEHLRTATFAADLASNSLYYGLSALGGPERALAVGAALGAAAGIGAVLLPPAMRLGDEEVRRTPATSALAFAMYLGGGLVAGLVYRSMARPR